MTLRTGIWLGPIILLMIALLKMPYSYYQILRIIIFCTSVYIVIQEKDYENFWKWAFVACALMYNPIARISLGREIWLFMNIATIVLYGLHYVMRGVNSAITRGK